MRDILPTYHGSPTGSSRSNIEGVVLVDKRNGGWEPVRLVVVPVLATGVDNVSVATTAVLCTEGDTLHVVVDKELPEISEHVENAG